jgi:hypothetical protein
MRFCDATQALVKRSTLARQPPNNHRRSKAGAQCRTSANTHTRHTAPLPLSRARARNHRDPPPPPIPTGGAAHSKRAVHIARADHRPITASTHRDGGAGRGGAGAVGAGLRGADAAVGRVGQHAHWRRAERRPAAPPPTLQVRRSSRQATVPPSSLRWQSVRLSHYPPLEAEAFSLAPSRRSPGSRDPCCFSAARGAAALFPIAEAARVYLCIHHPHPST